MTDLIRQIPEKGSPGWFNWSKYGWNVDTAPRENPQRAMQVSERPYLKDGVRIRDDGLIYDSITRTMYSADHKVVEMLKESKGELTYQELGSKFGEETLGAVIETGLLR